MKKSGLSMRERKKRETKAKILRAARQLFEKNGYETTPLEDIAEKADISRPTIFNYFTSKDNLIVSIAEEEASDVVYYATEELKAEKSAKQKIRLVLRRTVEDGIKYLHLTGTIINATSISNGECPSSIYVVYSNVWTSLIKEAQASGELSLEYSTEAISLAIRGIYYGVMFKCFETGQTAEAVSDTDCMVDLLFSAISA